MTTDLPAQWHCEAYGEKGAEVGALCFFAALHERVCDSLAECSTAVTAERVRVHGVIHEKADAGDPTFVFLAAAFPTPEGLLGGGDPDR